MRHGFFVDQTCIIYIRMYCILVTSFISDNKTETHEEWNLNRIFVTLSNRYLRFGYRILKESWHTVEIIYFTETVRRIMRRVFERATLFFHLVTQIDYYRSAGISPIATTKFPSSLCRKSRRPLLLHLLAACVSQLVVASDNTSRFLLLRSAQIISRRTFDLRSFPRFNRARLEPASSVGEINS